MPHRRAPRTLQVGDSQSVSLARFFPRRRIDAREFRALVVSDFDKESILDPRIVPRSSSVLANKQGISPAVNLQRLDERPSRLAGVNLYSDISGSGEKAPYRVMRCGDKAGRETEGTLFPQ